MVRNNSSVTRNVAFRVLVVGLASLMLVVAGPVSAVWGGPAHSTPGQPGPNGTSFPTPFMIGITAFVVKEVKDCVTGAVIPPEKLVAEFVFKDGSQAPFHFNQLEKIILKAEGYQPKEITQFMTMQFRLGFVVLTFIVPLEQNICLMPQDAVLWQEERKLTWDDFQGEPDEESKHDAWTVSGFTQLEWECDEQGQFTFKGAQAYFDQSESWVKPDKKSDDLLQHEQGHFDITELYARKLRQELRKIKCDHKTQEEIQKEVDAAYEKIEKEWDAEQEKYDDETDHGRNKDKQKEWNEKIKKQLKETKGQ